MKIHAMEQYLKNPKGIHLTYFNDVIYDEENNLTLQIIMPYSCNFKETFPCLLYVQGSGWSKQPLYAELPNLCNIALRGIVVAVVEYVPGLENFPIQIINCKTAIRYMKENASIYHIDENNVFVSGNSSGGHTAIMSALTIGLPAFSPTKYPTRDDSIKGVIDWYGPILNKVVHEELTKTCTKKQLQAFNPLNYINDKPLCPVLIFQGDQDKLVNKSDSIALYEALLKYNHKVEYIEMVGSDHGGPEFFEPTVIDIIEKFILGG